MMTQGVVQTDTVLDKILRQTAIDLDVRKREVSEAELEKRIGQDSRAPLPLAEHLSRDHVAVIAEVKRGSPSRGIFPVEIDAGEVAASYKAGGAAAISCLTDGPFFHGSQADLEQVSSVVHGGEEPIPVLRKDFTIDRYQLLEARAWGADAVLLIVAALDDDLLRSLYSNALDLDLSVLVEVHDASEVERAMELDPAILGVNNRNLHTFDVDLAVTERLAEHIPDAVCQVSESGIFTADHVSRVAASGASAVLVGESLILQDDRATAVSALASVPRRKRG